MQNIFEKQRRAGCTSECHDSSDNRYFSVGCWESDEKNLLKNTLCFKICGNGIGKETELQRRLFSCMMHFLINSFHHFPNIPQKNTGYHWNQNILKYILHIFVFQKYFAFLSKQISHFIKDDEISVLNFQ